MREFLQTQKECAEMGHEWEEVPGGSWCPNCDAFSPYPDDEMSTFGCCFPKECQMSGLHFMSECHTAEMYEAAMQTQRSRK